MEKMFLIYANEGVYQGLHGIEDYAVIEDDTEDFKMCNEVGYEMSYNLIYTYNTFEFDEDEEEEDQICDNELIQYCFYEIRDPKGKSCQELQDEITHSGDLDEFIEKYDCIERY